MGDYKYQELFFEIRKIISEQNSVSKDKIFLKSSLANDLVIAGDEGVQLFEELDKHNQVNWEGTDIYAIFGCEGFRLIPPKIAQECSVEDLVNSIHAGVWMGKPVRVLSYVERIRIFIRTLLFFIIFSLVIFFFIWLFDKL